MICLLCGSQHNKLLLKKSQEPLKGREYHLCSDCGLIFVPEHQHISLAEQKSYYDTHDNGAHQQGYLDFLNQLVAPLLNHVSEKSYGLDFGCGPGPVVHLLCKDHGHTVKNFDPIYKNDSHLLQNQYDFITCTEVIEHFSNPKNDFLKIKKLLKPKSILGFMTQFYPNLDSFENWWYHKDPTHICFYQEKTFCYLAESLNLEILEMKNPIVIFKSQSL